MSSPARRGARAFCEADSWTLIEGLARGEELLACYIVRESRRMEAKSGKDYLRLQLADRTGTIDAMVWDDVDRWEPDCVVDAYIGVRARVGSYQDRVQLTVNLVERLDPDAEEMEHFIAASPRPRVDMEKELDRLIASVRDPAFSKLLQLCLGRGSELGRAFRIHPAAKRNHHAYLSGLLEHTLSVALLTDSIATHYTTQGLALDRDLLLTGALLHDLGKVRELKALPASGYTDEGQLLGHIVLGIQIVQQAATEVPEMEPERLLLLQHLIASHQGKPEWDSPKVPQVVEGIILHYADDLDAKLNQVGSLVAGIPAGGWSPYDRNFARSFFQPPRAVRTQEQDPGEPEAAAELVIDLFPR